MQALCGIRVLDLTHILAGPYATMMLGDLGAEVIKIEPPGTGERTRAMLAAHPELSVHGMGAYFLALNRNKKSVTLDLKSSRGRELFYALVERADVVVENFGPGVTARLAIDAQSLARVNPAVITCSVTGFGQTGPDRDRVSFDLVAQATGGGMSITGAGDGPPTRAGIPIGDLGAGMMAVIGVLSALHGRAHGGVGTHVDISMQDCQVSLLNYVLTMYAMSGAPPQRDGNAHMVHVPYNAYRAADGWLVVAVVLDPVWPALLAIVDCPELDSEQNRTREGRVANRATIDQRLSARFATRPRAHWLERLREARIPCAPVQDVAEVMDDPQVLARHMVAQVAHPLGGSVAVPGNPIKLSQPGAAAAAAQAYASPPLLGEHTEQVLRELAGTTDAELAELRRDGII